MSNAGRMPDSPAAPAPTAAPAETPTVPETRLESLQTRYGRYAWWLALAGVVLLGGGTFMSWSYV